MKKKILLIVLIVAFISLFVVRRNYYDNRVIELDLYLMYGIDRNKPNILLQDEKDYVCEIVKEALTGFYTWEQLPLTDHFKEKFKNRRHILKEIDSIEFIGTGFMPFDERKVIYVMADEKQNFIEEKLFPSVTVESHFKYVLDGDKLDDIELIKKQYTHTPTQEVLKVIK